MKFVDQNGSTILEVPDDAERVDFPELEDDVVCINLADGLRSLSKLTTFYCILPDLDGGQDEVEAVRGLSRLREMFIHPLSSQHDLAPIATCTCLSDLRLVGLDKVDLAPLASLTNLEKLSLDGSTKNLAAVGSLTRLKSLSVCSNKRVSLKWFSNLSNIEELWFVASRLSDFDMFRNFPRLRSLDVRNTNIASLACLADNTGIETLRLGLCRKLESLEGIERLTALVGLYIDKLKSIPSLRPLAALRRLRTLDLSESRVVDGDLSPLMQLPELAKVCLMNDYGDQPAELARRLPNCEVHVIGGDIHEIQGSVNILRDYDPEADSSTYRIDQTLTDVLSVETNDEAEEMVQEEMERRFPESLKDLEFDSEGEAFVVRSTSIDAIRLVARCINDLEQEAK